MDSSIQQYRPSHLVEQIRDNTERIALLRQRIPWWIDLEKLRAMLDEYFASRPRFSDATFQPVTQRISYRVMMAQEWFKTYEPLAWIARMDDFWTTIVAKAQALVDQAAAIIRDMETWGVERLQDITSFISGRRELLMARINAAIETITGSNAHMSRPLMINAGPAGTGWTDKEDLQGTLNYYPMDLDFTPFDQGGQVYNPDGLNLGKSAFVRTKVNGVDRYQFNAGAMVYDRPTIVRYLDALYNRPDTYRTHDSEAIRASSNYADFVARSTAGLGSYNFCYRIDEKFAKLNPTLNIMKQESDFATRKPGYISTIHTLQDDSDMIVQNAQVEPLPADLIVDREDPAPDPNDILDSLMVSSQTDQYYNGDGELPPRPIRSA